MGPHPDQRILNEYSDIEDHEQHVNVGFSGPTGSGDSITRGFNACAGQPNLHRPGRRGPPRPGPPAGIDYNGQFAQACAAYGANCEFDNNAVFTYPFAFNQLSGWDYFHPNTSGQAVLASVSYAAGFGW